MRKTLLFFLAVGIGLLLSSCAPKPEELFQAVKDGKIEKVRTILDMKPDLLEAKKENGMTAIHEAVYAGNLEMVKVLVARNANINAKKEGGYTPLHIAAQKGNNDICMFLVKSKARANLTDDFGVTPAKAAESNGHRELAKQLRVYESY
jgi:ankyrin repeat protein